MITVFVGGRRVLRPSKRHYFEPDLELRTIEIKLQPKITVPVYVPRHEVTPDGKHKYHCFAVTTSKISDFSELKEADQRWLEKLGVQHLPQLLKVVAISENYIPLHYADAFITKVHDEYNAVAVLRSPANIAVFEQFFKDNALFIKTLDNMRLYFLGYYKPREGQPRVIRFYTPKSTTDKHYYHMQIIRSLQARLPEAVYKKLRQTLNLRIQGEQLVFNMFRGDRVQEVKADFTVPTISVCVENLRELAQDPVNFLIACYAEMIK